MPLNKDKSLQWQYVGSSNEALAWSRILYKSKDIKKVQHILSASKN